MKRALLVLAIALPQGCRRDAERPTKKPPVHVHCEPATERELRDVRIVRGTVAAVPDRDAVIAAQVPGRLLRVPLREGDAVTKDGIVAEVESRSVRDGLRQADAQLAQARAARVAAASEASRQEHLFEKGISAKQALEQARAALAAADAQVTVAAAQVDASRQGVERAEVRSPLAGVVVRVFRRPGEVVDGTAATPILEVADPSALELAASAPPADLVLLRVGQLATLRFDALAGHTFHGSLRAVAPAIDPTTGVGTVRITIEASEVRPPLGLAGLAEVLGADARRAVVVPAAAVRKAGGAKTEVVECRDGHASVRAVVTGDRRDGVVEIVNGLTAGARVVVDEAAALEDRAEIEDEP